MQRKYQDPTSAADLAALCDKYSVAAEDRARVLSGEFALDVDEGTFVLDDSATKAPYKICDRGPRVTAPRASSAADLGEQVAALVERELGITSKDAS